MKSFLKLVIFILFIVIGLLAYTIFWRRGLPADIDISQTLSSIITDEPSGPLEWPTDVGTSHFGRLTDMGRIDSELEGGWVRPHAGPFIWDMVERKPGSYDWRSVDKEVRYWQKNRQAILVTVWGFAQWDQEICHAEDEPAQEPFIRSVDSMYAPCDQGAYLDWLFAMVERYDGDGINDMDGLSYPIRHWEIFNEPSIQANPSFFQSEPAVYAQLLNDSYETIKRADENAVVLPAGQSGMHREAQAYWEDVLKDIEGYFDMGNIHSIGADDVFWSDGYRAFLTDAGYEATPYWITEALVGSFLKNLTEDKLAQQTFTGYVEAFANGASVIFNVGAHDPTGGPGDASEDVFNLLAQTIGAFASVERVDDTSVLFVMDDGTQIYALWNGESLPSDLEEIVEIIDYTGTRSSLNASEVVANVPMFVMVN